MTNSPALADPFTLAEARAAGLTAEQLRGTPFHRRHRGVYELAEGGNALDVRCLAARLALPKSAAFSHLTAAALYGLPVSANGRLVATVCSDGPVPDHQTIVVHGARLPAEHVREWHGLRVVTPARTFLDLSATLSFVERVVLGDAVVHARLATREELLGVIEWAYRRRGVRRAAEAMPHLDAGAESPMESRTRMLLVLGGLPRPGANVDLYDDFGGWLARGDLVYREAKLVLEYLGADHLDRRRHASDQQRARLLVAAGYEVLCFTADDVLRRPDRVVAEVRAALRRRTPLPR